MRLLLPPPIPLKLPLQRPHDGRARDVIGAEGGKGFVLLELANRVRPSPIREPRVIIPLLI